MKVHPIRKKLLVKTIKRELKTASGLYLPETEKFKEGDTQEGIVVSVGKDADKELKAGQKVLFFAYHGDDLEVDGEKHKLMDDSTILGVIDL